MALFTLVAPTLAVVLLIAPSVGAEFTVTQQGTSPNFCPVGYEPIRDEATCKMARDQKAPFNKYSTSSATAVANNFHYWSFQGGAATDSYDAWNGQPTGGVTFSSDTINGNVKPVASFDGTSGSYIELPDITHGGGGYTFCSWVKFEAVPTGRYYLFSIGGAHDWSDPYVWFGHYATERNSEFAVKAANIGNNWDTCNANPNNLGGADFFPLNTWVHVCATLDEGGGKYIFRNGVKAKQCVNSKAADPLNGITSTQRTSAFIGAWSPQKSESFQGKMTDVLVLDGKALLEDEIKQLYDNGIPATTEWLGRDENAPNTGCFVEGGSMVLLPAGSSPSMQMQQVCQSAPNCRSAETRVSSLIRNAHITSYRESESPCADDTKIESSETCEAAAAVLGMTYQSEAGAEWATGCLIHNGGVYFSQHADGSTENPTNSYICLATDAGPNWHFWPLTSPEDGTTVRDVYEQWNAQVKHHSDPNKNQVTFNTDMIQGKEVSVATFNGKWDTWLKLPGIVHGGDQGYTVCSWVKHEEIVDTYEIFQVKQGSGELHLGSWNAGNTKARLRVYDEGWAKGDECITDSGFYTLGVWTHVCGVVRFSNGVRNYEIFKDGVSNKICTNSQSGAFPNVQRDTALIGRRMKGSLSQMLVLDGLGLSPDQVAQVYQGGAPDFHPSAGPSDLAIGRQWTATRDLSSKIADNACALDAKADIDNVYTKDSVYSKTEIDQWRAGEGDHDDELDAKADKTQVYTKAEVDTAMLTKANAADVYTKTEVYTKENVDILIQNLKDDIQALKDELDRVNPECMAAKVQGGTDGTRKRRAGSCLGSPAASASEDSAGVGIIVGVVGAALVVAAVVLVIVSSKKKTRLDAPKSGNNLSFDNPLYEDQEEGDQASAQSLASNNPGIEDDHNLYDDMDADGHDMDDLYDVGLEEQGNSGGDDAGYLDVGVHEPEVHDAYVDIANKGASEYDGYVDVADVASDITAAQEDSDIDEDMYDDF